MDTFNLIFMLIMVIGFIIIIISLVKINKEDRAMPLSSFEKSLNEVRTALNQADIAIEDLNFISEEMFKQFEQKQKELMFIYDAIEKKRADLNMTLKQGANNNIDIKLDKVSPLNNKQQSLESNNKNNIKGRIEHPLLPKIKELLDQNYSLPEIAKILNIGQGELNFIMELGMR